MFTEFIKENLCSLFLRALTREEICRRLNFRLDVSAFFKLESRELVMHLLPLKYAVGQLGMCINSRAIASNRQTICIYPKNKTLTSLC
jgi:hypothetical protein